MSEPVPQCYQCMSNIGDGACYRDNNGKKLEQLKTVCPHRTLFHNCETCIKEQPTTCNRKKHVGIGLCRGDWVQNPRFDNIVEAKQA